MHAVPSHDEAQEVDKIVADIVSTPISRNSTGETAFIPYRAAKGLQSAGGMRTG